MSERWFVVNVRDTDSESKGAFGVRCRFESPDARPAHFGITVQVIEPGRAAVAREFEEGAGAPRPSRRYR